MVMLGDTFKAIDIVLRIWMILKSVQQKCRPDKII